AEASLKKAESAYKAILAKAGRIRKALWARNLALATLPYYGQWAARQRGPKADERVTRLEGLWQQVHELDEQLDTPTSELPATDIRAEELEKGLQSLWREFEVEYKSFLRVAAGSRPGRWHDIQAALAIPFIPAEDRQALLKKSLDISYD